MEKLYYIKLQKININLNSYHQFLDIIIRWKIDQNQNKKTGKNKKYRKNNNFWLTNKDPGK